MKHALAVCIALLPNLAHADPESYSTSDGRVYIYVGADEDGLLYAQDDETENYTMNFDCTVINDTLGAGEWHFANGGWVIEYDGVVKLGFPRQAPPLDVPACAF
jgi:hypothetical protein